MKGTFMTERESLIVFLLLAGFTLGVFVAAIFAWLSLARKITADLESLDEREKKVHGIFMDWMDQHGRRIGSIEDRLGMDRDSEGEVSPTKWQLPDDVGFGGIRPEDN